MLRRMQLLRKISKERHKYKLKEKFPNSKVCTANIYYKTALKLHQKCYSLDFTTKNCRITTDCCTFERETFSVQSARVQQ